ncbi:MAG: GIY-YIG nuclease family protein [Candidatus Margulisbacteria bacterium]|nr:GIY-YIG nuclease family protein [Candidatus Margulisiibacteriota bacterium]
MYNKKCKIWKVGQTKAMVERLEAHNAGRVKSTKAYKPYEILYCEEVESRKEAMRKEKQVKNLKSTNRILEYINKNIQRCPDCPESHV